MAQGIIRNTEAEAGEVVTLLYDEVGGFAGGEGEKVKK